MQLPAFLLDPILRRAAALHATPLDRYTVRVARTIDDYEAAFRLVHAAYTFLGIENVRHDGVRVLPQHLLAESTVLVAYEGTQIVGTMTVIADSRAGLPLDKQYPQSLAALRRGGARLVEYASLAVVKRCWATGVTQLLSIAAYNLAFNHLGATHTVIGVHPRAGAFYRAMFDFHELGEAQPHSELTAPVVGLVQDMAKAQPFVRRKFKKRMASGKLPIEHFLGAPPRCVELPPLGMSGEELKRWKLPRTVFQELFLRKYDRLGELGADALAMLGEQRTGDTLEYRLPVARDTEPCASMWDQDTVRQPMPRWSH